MGQILRASGKSKDPLRINPRYDQGNAMAGEPRCPDLAMPAEIRLGETT